VTMDKRMQRAKVNAGTTLLLQLVTTVSGLLIPKIMIEVFGSEAYGATTSIAQFLAYISLFEAGIGRVARGALYGPLARKNEEEVSSIYLAVKRFFSILGYAFLGYALLLAIFYYDIADVAVFTRKYTFFLVISIAIGKFAEYMGGISNITLFNADQRQYVVNSVSIFSSILNVICIFLLSYSGADILWVKLVSSFVFILKPIIFTFYLKSHYHIKKSKTRAVLKNKVTGIAQHTAYVIQNNTDVLLLTVFGDLKLVAVYSVYHLVCFSLRNITSAFTGGMEAVFGNMIAKGEIDELRKTYTKYKFILTFLTITLFGTAAALIVSFVSLYTHEVEDANYIQPVFAFILLLGEAINCIILPCFNLPIAANQLKQSRMGAYSEAAINLVSSLVLVFWNPLIGVAMGTLLSALFKSVYYIIYSSRHVLKVKVSSVLWRFIVAIGVLIAVGIIGMMIVSTITIYKYVTWIAVGFCTVAVVGVVAIIVCAVLYPNSVKRISTFVLKKIHK